MPSHGFDKNLIRIIFFSTSRGPFGFSKTVFAMPGGNFSTMKKYCVSRSLSNMSKNGLRMVVHLNFDITHLSPPSSKEMIDNNFNDKQLEKLEAAITFPYLFLTFLTSPYLFLSFLTFPDLS